MSDDRKEKLNKLIKEAELNKVAQEAIDGAKDSEGEEFAHKIFEALLNNLKIEGLDD